MQVSTKVFNEQSVSRFNELTEEVQNAQSKIASGKKVLAPSDDPLAASNISVAIDQKVALERFSKNIDHARNRLSLTESVIGDSVNVLTRIYELSIQAKNGTYNPQDLKSIGAEITQLKDALLGFSNMKDQNGNYLFSGFKVKEQPFQENPDGAIVFVGGRGVNTVQASESLRLNTGIDGAELFTGSISGNQGGAFEVIMNMERDLMNGISPQDSSEGIRDAIDHFSFHHASVGAQINKGETLQASVNKRTLILTENLSKLQDADLTKLVTDLQSLMVSRDAAQKAFVKITQQSLFDFIR